MAKLYTLLLFVMLLVPTVRGEELPSGKNLDDPIIAVKSNLLFDAASLINFELELPIGNRYSVAVEWLFPWWRWGNGLLSSHQHTLQMLQGTVEIRRFLGDRTQRAVMTGWFTSLYAGGGLYDYERNEAGYQGDFILAVGIGGGYAHTINRSGSLRMEYMLGVGYLQSKYKYYRSMNTIDNQWHAVEVDNGNVYWFGLTRAKVSLVWLLTRRNLKGGVK
ncbi:MAG: DUF3575 domain-containing protein [Rikenellaceae bacterium]